MTGGAFGSLLSQFMHLTSAERRTLLGAGAAAGMSATFAAPLSSALLAVELLLVGTKRWQQLLIRERLAIMRWAIVSASYAPAVQESFDGEEDGKTKR